MTLKEQARTLTGAATVLVLLGLIAVDTVYAGIQLSLEDKAILVSMAASLLGFDLALNQLGVTIQNNDTSGRSQDDG